MSMPVRHIHLQKTGLYNRPRLNNKDKYDELVDTGSISYIDTLTGGATLEETDMVDIK